MKLNVYHCILVTVESENDNKRKNDVPELYVVVDKKNVLPITSILEVCDMKKKVREALKEILDESEAHTEQVYTLAEKRYGFDGIASVIYLSVIHSTNIHLKENYSLIPFDILESCIKWGERKFLYRTVKHPIGNHFEYIHEIDCKNIVLEKSLLCSLIAYKYLKNRIDYTDTIFHLLPNLFTLEQVRILYEKIKCVTVDKSNFRKRILKYCEETDEIMNSKGYRPAKYYKFKVREDDVWI
ncbi:MAG: hypothetical protein HFH08_06635 [Bacilli bacterium]|nr:hypothetical protein [Bacilli bacterium]